MQEAIEFENVTGKARARVKLNGEENVVLFFSDNRTTEPLAWGFQSIRDFKRYVKMLLRFDEQISDSPIETNSVQMLLDGLGVGSIAELKQIVDRHLRHVAKTEEAQRRTDALNALGRA